MVCEMRWVAFVAICALATGCFGYNRSAKRWAYVGDTVLIIGGGGAVAADVVGGHEKVGEGVAEYQPLFGGLAVVGVLLVAGGIAGMVINATRPDVKLSR